MKPRLAIYWDVQNVRISPEDIPLLNLWFTQQGDIVIKKAYADWTQENKLFAQALHKVGFKTIHNPLDEKNAVDHEIIRDREDDIRADKRIKTVILITGDKDYLSLVKNSKESEAKVILIHGDNVSRDLKKAVYKAYNIKKVIASTNPDKATPEKLDSPPILPYEEAKKYLIDLIKTVQSKGKKATLALIGNFIKNHPRFSGYKKVSYCRPDGKIVSKFSKFVEAVIKEGIIQNKNGELILVKI